MAKYYEPTEEQLHAYSRYLDDMSPDARRVAERFQPWCLYRRKSGGTRFIVFGIDVLEGGAITVVGLVSGDFNLVAFEREVFGLDPDELEECELPGPGEPTGCALTLDNVQSIQVQ